jgi:hypothetical protein
MHRTPAGNAGMNKPSASEKEDGPQRARHSSDARQKGKNKRTGATAARPAL